MRNFVVMIVLLVLVGGGLYIAFVKPDLFKKTVTEGSRESKGYTASQTPQEAIDKFRDAIKSRVYATSAPYCGGDYAEQMRKGANAAKKLGTPLDDLAVGMGKHGITQTVKIKFMLRLLEPFPPSIKTLEIKKQG